MRIKLQPRIFVSLLLTFCLLVLPATAFAKKGEKNYKQGLRYEAAQQWEKAAQEFTLAVAADPASVEYQLHFRRASFNASQSYMQQGRSLAEQNDFVGAFPGRFGFGLRQTPGIIDWAFARSAHFFHRFHAHGEAESGDRQ